MNSVGPFGYDKQPMSTTTETAVAAVATVAGAIIGALITRYERRPKLIAYYGHTSAFVVEREGKKFGINAHSVVIRNVGKRPATNVRVSHHVLPDFVLYPNLQHQREAAANAADDIVIKRLLPGQEVAIDYIYDPPMVFQNVNRGIQSDEVGARQVVALLTPQVPGWRLRGGQTLMLLGAVAALYFLFRGARALFHF